MGTVDFPTKLLIGQKIIGSVKTNNCHDESNNKLSIIIFSPLPGELDWLNLGIWKKTKPRELEKICKASRVRGNSPRANSAWKAVKKFRIIWAECGLSAWRIDRRTVQCVAFVIE